MPVSGNPAPSAALRFPWWSAEHLRDPKKVQSNFQSAQQNEIALFGTASSQGNTIKAIEEEIIVLAQDITTIETTIAPLTTPGTAGQVLGSNGTTAVWETYGWQTHYDVAHTYNTPAATTIDTTNLKLPITIPHSGNLRTRVSATFVIQAGTSLGVGWFISGSLVGDWYALGTAPAITQLGPQSFTAEIPLTGLTPGAATLDLAWNDLLGGISSSVLYTGTLLSATPAAPCVMSAEPA